MKKYEITDIAHPDNPKLHRIRALTDVGADVHKGDFGGYVETEDNLDQEGFAWIGEDAIACEDSYIGGYAILADSAVARDSAYVGNNAVIADHAVVQDNAIVCGGYISGNSCICGNAILNADTQTLCAPMIGGNARVYGELTGNVVCQGSAVVLPGVKLYNTTADCFVLKDDTVSVVPAQKPEVTAYTVLKDGRKPNKAGIRSTKI